MRLVAVDETSSSRQPTVNKNFSLGGEHVRRAVWRDGDTTVTVEVIAYVSGIRLRKNSDGSQDLLGQVSRFDVMLEHESVQPIERAVFLWSRQRPAPDDYGPDWIYDEDIDYSNEIGVFYQPTLEAAEANAKHWLDELDFEEQFDPAAWEVPSDG